jgi:hypothetical protein
MQLDIRAGGEKVNLFLIENDTIGGKCGTSCL